ncbi:oxidoreductase [Butyrivibrio sp. MC2021]|uniref:oxidoreductase n=1 Tax=Butyrivibrio sp. MC2021 TaxID=1408306 RepID=UPI002E8DD3A1|nr:hypothetical protein [Butyrivibrio sp. MC2021]
MTINKIVVRNRLTMAPTVKFDFAGADAFVSEKHIQHYKERAEHGCGLICVEATAVTPGGRFGRNHMGLWSDEFIEGHAQIAKVCHDAGAPVIIQLNHAGRDSAPDLGEQIAPSAVPTRDENVLAEGDPVEITKH